MKNHLIIGLGGTGGKIIRSLRKTIYQDFRNNNPEDVNIGYLYMDTSDEMMQMDDQSWKVLGSSVQLDEGSKVYIKPGDLIEVLGNIKRYNGIKDWIGSIDDWTEYLNSQSGLNTAGGQRRRLGRFIFACNIPLFEKTLKAQVQNLQNKSGETDVQFHVCCGLAGGTGAGTIIDVLAQIRKIYIPSNITNYKIILYLFLPEENPKENRDGGFYHSNGYAALSELNAYGVGAFLPIDVSSQNSSGDTRFTNIQDPYNGAYIFSNINENGNIIDVDNDVPNVVSDFLFQKIISIKDMEWKRDKLERQENNENLDAAPEQTSTGPERSVRFLAFGVKRIAIPEEEIREYITYNYAKQATLQLRYNNWSDEIGFRNEAVNQNFNELVNNKKTHEGWRTTEEHFQLSLPIIEDTVTKRWKKIVDTWRFVIPEYKLTAKEKSDSNWLDELKKICEKQYQEQYRNMGVLKFYEAKIADRKDLAHEIISKIEQELFSDWGNGVKSLFDIKRFLDAIIDNFKKKSAEIDDKVIIKSQHEEQRLINIIENEKKWANLGVLSSVFGRKNKLLDSQSIELEELYIYKTQIEGLKFSKFLYNETIEQLNVLKNQIDKSNHTFDLALKEFEKNINERCNDTDAKMNKEEIYKNQVIRFYDPGKVISITKAFIRDKKEQSTQTSNVRQALISKLSGSNSFATFNERINKSVLVSELEKICDQNAKNAEASLPSEKRLFDISIVGKLKEKYDGNYEELKRYVKKLVDYSGCFVTFDQNEINKNGDGVKLPPTKIKTFTVVIPKSLEYQDFIANLEQAFRETTPAGIVPDFVYTTNKKFEIVLLSLINGFPLRYVSQVNILRRKYQERIAKDDQKKAKMFLHTEGNGEDLPRLFIPSQKEMEIELESMRRDSIQLILLSLAFGVIQEKIDENGYKKMAIVEQDLFGDSVDKFYLATKIHECYKTISYESYEYMKSITQNELKTNYKHKVRKDELKNKLIEIVKQIRLEREDSVYLLHKSEAEKIINELN